MNCERIQDSLVQFLLEELPHSEFTAVKEHLETGCCVCNEQVRELREGMGMLFEAAPKEDLSPEFVHRVMKLASGDHVQLVVSTPAHSAPKVTGAKLFGIGIASMAAGLAAAALGFWLLDNPHGPQLSRSLDSDRQRDNLLADSPRATGDQGVSSRATALGDFLPQSAVPSDASSQFISARTSTPASNLRANIVVDLYAKQVHFFASGFTPPTPGHDYVLWFSDGQTSQPICNLEIDHQGACKAVSSIPSDQVDGFFVTLEPEGPWAPNPQGQQQLSFEDL